MRGGVIRAAHPLDQAAQVTLASLTGGLSPASMTLAMLDWAMHVALAAGHCLDLAMHVSNASSAAANRGTAAQTDTLPSADAAGDPRFADAAWAHWPYCRWRDGFLSVQSWWREATAGEPGVSRHHEDMVSFGARQWLDAWSPSNVVALNPLVQKTAVRSGGANFAAGARHWLEDAEDIASAPRGKRTVRERAYRPGRELAITPGRVVLRNALCELLQYTPASTRVAREPVFIVPSWIMKYYILDLQPHNSLIRYLVGEGFSVFAVSWRNPDAQDRELALGDYLKLGVLEPLAYVRERCDSLPVHAVGYCLGGTLLAIAAPEAAVHEKLVVRCPEGGRCADAELAGDIRLQLAQHVALRNSPIDVTFVDGRATLVCQPCCRRSCIECWKSILRLMQVTCIDIDERN